MKTLILTIAISLLTFNLSAQKWEAGVFLGGSNYAGDLTPGRIVLSETHPAIGGLVRYNISKHFSMKLGGYYATISGSDLNSTDPNIRLRNLSFKSRIYEIGMHGEWNIAPQRIQIRGNDFTPYLFAGVAFFYFNPQTIYQEESVYLQPLGTEGQNLAGYEDRQYSLYQVSLPMGVGFKYEVNGQMSLGIEFGARKTFTDYLDDVSSNYVNNEVLLEQSGTTASALADRSGEVEPGHVFRAGAIRGNPETMDWYMLGGVNLTFILSTHAERFKRMECSF